MSIEDIANLAMIEAPKKGVLIKKRISPMFNNQEVRTLKQRCPCCKEQGYLELFVCDECKKITARCDLVFTEFTDPLDISLNKVYEGDPFKCENCGAFDKKRIANDFELAEIGLLLTDNK